MVAKTGACLIQVNLHSFDLKDINIWLPNRGGCLIMEEFKILYISDHPSQFNTSISFHKKLCLR